LVGGSRRLHLRQGSLWIVAGSSSGFQFIHGYVRIRSLGPFPIQSLCPSLCFRFGFLIAVGSIRPESNRGSARLLIDLLDHFLRVQDCGGIDQIKKKTGESRAPFMPCFPERR
jgi:hypothetical protein